MWNNVVNNFTSSSYIETTSGKLRSICVYNLQRHKTELDCVDKSNQKSLRQSILSLKRQHNKLIFRLCRFLPFGRSIMKYSFSSYEKTKSKVDADVFFSLRVWSDSVTSTRFLEHRIEISQRLINLCDSNMGEKIYISESDWNEIHKGNYGKVNSNRKSD